MVCVTLDTLLIRSGSLRPIQALGLRSYGLEKQVTASQTSNLLSMLLSLFTYSEQKYTRFRAPSPLGKQSGLC